jgi:hypothetical protein
MNLYVWSMNTSYMCVYEFIYTMNSYTYEFIFQSMNSYKFHDFIVDTRNSYLQRIQMSDSDRPLTAASGCSPGTIDGKLP